MKKILNYGSLIIVFSVISAGIYMLQLLLFHEPEEMSFLLFQDLAFVPIEALVVTLFLDRVLHLSQKKQNLKKTNVIISAFFSELGGSIVCLFSKLVKNNDELGESFNLSQLSKKEMKSLKKRIMSYDFIIELTADDLENLGSVLINKMPFMISMLENSSLLEHDTFTDMLWAVFHVADELQNRNLQRLSGAEMDHLKNDVLRAYRAILAEWIHYIKYLQKDYPFLYASAMKKSPFGQST